LASLFTFFLSSHLNFFRFMITACLGTRR